MGSYASGVWSYSNPHFESHSFAISVDGKAHGVTLDSTGTHGTVTIDGGAGVGRVTKPGLDQPVGAVSAAAATGTTPSPPAQRP